MSRFQDFWDVYPKGRRSNKKGCETKWKQKQLDTRADVIVEDVLWRSKYDKKWTEGYIPMPATYLNQERWHDDRQDVRDMKRRVNGNSDIARLGIPEVRRGAIALMIKKYPDDVICKTFGISEKDCDELRKDTTAYKKLPVLPGDKEAGYW